MIELPNPEALTDSLARVRCIAYGPHAQAAIVARQLHRAAAAGAELAQAAREAEQYVKVIEKQAQTRAKREAEKREAEKRAADEARKREILAELSRERRSKELLAEAKALGLDSESKKGMKS